jgi:hypothetical protein
MEVTSHRPYTYIYGPINYCLKLLPPLPLYRLSGTGTSCKSFRVQGSSHTQMCNWLVCKLHLHVLCKISLSTVASIACVWGIARHGTQDQKTHQCAKNLSPGQLRWRIHIAPGYLVPVDDFGASGSFFGAHVMSKPHGEKNGLRFRRQVLRSKIVNGFCVSWSY